MAGSPAESARYHRDLSALHSGDSSGNLERCSESRLGMPSSAQRRQQRQRRRDRECEDDFDRECEDDRDRECEDDRDHETTRTTASARTTATAVRWGLKRTGSS
jgi:hypothetical protein